MTTTDTLWVPPAASAEPVATAPTRPRWERPAYFALLIGTAWLYLWDLGASGYGNDFYAAAVQAGTKSWKAFLFGSFDSSNFITVDKPPASLWVMELSGRIFGFNSWSMLAPNALEGVLAVAVLYAAVRRWFGPAAALISGVTLALTPVAVLMFRFNNPDGLMTLLCVVTAYCVVRALEQASTRWMFLAGLAMGFAFLAKGLQPFTIVPALALAYLVAAPTTLWRRVRQLLLAGAGIVVGAGWWVAAATLWPASDRPYIGGSGNNSVLGLAFGYNGLGRITGNESTAGGGFGGGGFGGPGGMFGGTTGIGRLFNDQMGTQIAWLIPAALVGMTALLWWTRGAARTDRTRASMLVWGGWLIVTGLVLSYAGGIIHAYYTVQLAPAIAAVVGMAAMYCWRRRADVAARAVLAAMILVTGVTAYELLGRTPSWYPSLRYAVLLLGLVAAAGLFVPTGRRKQASVLLGIVAVVVGLGGTAAYAAQTAATPHTGSTPAAGPAGAITNARFGGGPGAGASGGFGGELRDRFSGELRGGFDGEFGGGFGGQFRDRFGAGGSSGATPPADGAQVSSALTDLLEKTDTTWAAATVGSQSAAPLELASGKAVMAIGGFSGSDPAPTLEQFEQYVAQGKIRYFIAGGRGGPGGGNSSITSWVESHYSATTVGGTTVYDLTAPVSGTTS